MILCLLKYPQVLDYFKEAKPLLLSIYLNLDKNNMVNKGVIAVSKNTNMCNRTLNKYWHLLEDNEIIIKTSTPKTWMVNPEYVKIEGTSDKQLKQLWEETLHEHYN